MKSVQSRVFSDVERQTLDRAVAIIRKHLPNATIVLYGSRARGEAREDSDYDILVLTPNKVSSEIEDAIFDETYDILLKTDQWLSVFITDQATWECPISRGSPFYKEVCREGIEL